ncbi:MAG: hypothetical protein LAO18_14835 [Acidobacteriia bacterium]|nr:hypothetical protein [Terriglobia bacterium]
MSFDPESAPPEPEISSAETQPDENLTTGAELEATPPGDQEWRQRGEDLAPAIYDSEVRPEPAGDWDERTDPAFETLEPTAGEETTPDLRLVSYRAPGLGTAHWYAALLGLLTKNYRSLCQNAALVALGAAMALLAVGFSHRHSPLPAALRGQRSETIRPEVSPARARRKRPHPPTSLRDAAKRLANPKKESNLEPLKPTAGIKIVPGISLASERVSRHPRRPDFSSERNFVARDTVTHYDAQGAPAPK